MIVYDIPFVLLHISLLMVAIVAAVTWRIKNKTQIHYVFFALMVLLFIWSLGQLLEIYTRSIYGHTFMVFVYLYYLGLDFAPITFLFLGLIFANTKLTFTPKYFYLLIPPCVSYLILLTNDYHHLFFIYYSAINTQMVIGKYFLRDTLFNYTYIIIGFYQLFYFSIKNSGFFTKQSLLVAAGIIVPFLVNVLTTFKIVQLPTYLTPVMFLCSAVFLGLAILKYRFLNIIPIALDKVVNIISDSFIVVNEDLQIIDYNQSLVRLNILRIKRNENLIELLQAQGIITSLEAEKLIRWMQKVRFRKENLHFEKKVADKYFEIDVSPIFSKSKYIGACFLIKDITEHKKDIAMIQNTQKQLIERERLASLGELAAGVAHEINSPLAAIQTSLYIMERFITTSSKEADVLNLPSQRKIFEQLQENCRVSTVACKRIVQIVNSIRNQTRNIGDETFQEFYVMDIIKDLKVLLHYQLKQSGCEMMLTSDDDYKIKGDPGKLAQVLTNIIINAIQAYGTNPGRVEINIQKHLPNILITISDTAGGIPEKYQPGIFRNFLTTKGTLGTGLGLYISYAIITTHFKGDIWFDTKKGRELLSL